MWYFPLCGGIMATLISIHQTTFSSLHSCLPLLDQTLEVANGVWGKCQRPSQTVKVQSDQYLCTHWWPTSTLIGMKSIPPPSFPQQRISSKRLTETRTIKSYVTRFTRYPRFSGLYLQLNHCWQCLVDQKDHCQWWFSGMASGHEAQDHQNNCGECRLCLIQGWFWSCYDHPCWGGTFSRIGHGKED